MPHSIGAKCCFSSTIILKLRQVNSLGSQGSCTAPNFSTPLGVHSVGTKGGSSGLLHHTFMGNPHTSLAMSFVVPHSEVFRGVAPLSLSILCPRRHQWGWGWGSTGYLWTSDFRLSGNPRRAQDHWTLSTRDRATWTKGAWRTPILALPSSWRSQGGEATLMTEQFASRIRSDKLSSSMDGKRHQDYLPKTAQCLVWQNIHADTFSVFTHKAIHSPAGMAPKCYTLSQRHNSCGLNQ